VLSYSSNFVYESSFWAHCSSTRLCSEVNIFIIASNICRLQQLLLQPHEEGSRKGVSEELGDAGAAPMQKRSVGKVKVQGMLHCGFSASVFYVSTFTSTNPHGQQWKCVSFNSLVLVLTQI